MRTNLAKLSTFASVLFLSLVIAGCGGNRGDGNGMPGTQPGGEGADHDTDTSGSMAGGGTDPDADDSDAMAGGGTDPDADDSDAMAGGGTDPDADDSDAMAGGGAGAGPAAAASPEASNAAADAATAEPAFGSVTQSTNTDINGVTTDSASATFEVDPQGVPRLVVTITRTGQSDIRIETAGDDGDDNALDSYQSPIVGRTNAFAVPFYLSNTSLTLGSVDVGWSSNDATDYVAMGTWLNATGDFANGVVDSASIGAFVDGPEIRRTPTLPVTGTATYNGPAEGMYAAEYGTDYRVPEGSVEFGFFAGDTTLTADFGANTISGVVDSVSLVGATVTPSGDSEVFDAPTAYELHLGEASLNSNSNGTFTGDNVTLYHPGVDFDSNAGSWGGKFSYKNDSEGNPRLVAGTAGGSATTSGGTTSSFVGAFVGTTEHFE